MAKTKPELMSPAGHWPQLNAAVEAGADAVYFGLKHFSARAKVGFGFDELPEVMQSLHQRGVKGFVTFNTLVFDHELDLAAEAIHEIASAGCDAVIVQDIGIAEWIRQTIPELEIHGSTQMSVTSRQGVELAARFGCSRVVLGRELDLADIRRIATSTEIELEVFVHGALCVSYSGQCFSSEAWGGRSANRGQCAQACRLSYDLMVDGQPKDLGPYRYLLSPGDLCAIEQIPELIDVGIACVKIEGRYKDAEYVAVTTAAYRQAIDQAMADSCAKTGDFQQTMVDLEQAYSRGLGPHFMSGTNHQTVVQGRAPRHRGIHVGTVEQVGPNHVTVQLNTPVRNGDGVVFDAADWRSPDEPEEGGNIYQVVELKSNSGRVELRFGHGEVDFSRIRTGDLVWRTRDPRLRKRYKRLTDAAKPVYTRPIDFHVTAKVGEKLSVVAKSATGQTAEAFSEQPLEQSRNRSLDDKLMREQLGRLGGSPFHLGNLTTELDDVFVPVSVLNKIRRDLVEQILQRRAKSVPVRTAEISPINDFLDDLEQTTSEQTDTEPRLHLLVRTPEQLDAAIECRPASITLDYLELYGLRPSVEKIKAAGIFSRVASPRILKPNEQNIIRFLLSLECQILVRSGGLLNDLVTQEKPGLDALPELFGDFSLNAANAISFSTYLDMGLKRIAPTHDLNAEQILDLSKSIGPHRIEVVAYHQLPVFHTEHCLFCRFLSQGTDNTNCGHPCEKHRIAIRDANGRTHPVLADVGCRNTVFGAQAQSATAHLENFRQAGVSHFRLEFVHHSADAVVRVSNAYSQFFAGEISSQKLESCIESSLPHGATEGSLFVPRGFKELVQLS